jgi:hypothetical protein
LLICDCIQETLQMVLVFSLFIWELSMDKK